MRTLQLLAVGVLPLACSLANAHAGGLATFEGTLEGHATNVVSDGGVTFSNLDTGAGIVPPTHFHFDDASGTLATFPGFTPPMTLSFSGWTPGPNTSLSRFQSFEISTGQVENLASMDFYVAWGQNSIVIERRFAGVVVATDAFPLPTAPTIHHLPIALSGVPFDVLRVFGVGPEQNGAIFACLDNVAIDRLPGTAFCAGDGLDPAVTSACPCSNFGANGRGCANSVVPAGAQLTASGSTQLDTVALHASGMPASATSIYLQGDLVADEVFGDGVRCAGGVLLRMRARVSVGGANSFPDASDTISLSARGGVVPGSGVVRSYQTYYRNAAAAFCPPDTFNVTNAWSITW